MKRRIAIITSHPIQYNAPLFKLMNEEGKRFTVKVFYTWSQSKAKIFDPEFGLLREWDIPLLKGYDYTFVNNTSKNPGSHSFNGIITPTLITEVQEWKADAVLVFGWSFRSHLGALRYFHGKIPVLFRGDSTLLDELPGPSVKKFLRRGFLKWVYSHVNYALYVGQANQQYFLAHGIHQKRLLFTPHAVDNYRFSHPDSEYNVEANKWRIKLGIPEKAITFLYAAKLTGKKNPGFLIESFLSLNHASTWLLIVGNGDLEDKLKEKYKNISRLVFIDFQNQTTMPVVYRMGDVFVLPSKGPGETWGLAVNEAMACGRGVIVSDNCGCSKDLVHNGINGLRFRSNDIESLESCMRLALSSWETWGHNSKRIIKEWNYSKTVTQLDQLLSK